MPCYDARVEHAHVDPHVNCFIPRRLSTLDEYEKERSYKFETRGAIGTGEPSGLRARYDRGFQTLYYFYATRGGKPDDSPPAINAPVQKPFVSNERKHLTNQVELDDLLPLVLNLKQARWIFDVLGKLDRYTSRAKNPFIICKLI